MKFQLNNDTANWLIQLNGKTVDKIFQVDFNNDRHNDVYLPWIFFVTFSDFDKFLEIEGDFDGDHIRINFCDNSELDNKLKKNNLSDEQGLWRVYDTEKGETAGKLLGKKIEFIEFGIDKEEFEINGSKMKGQKDVFRFIRFNCDDVHLTIFEYSGLRVSDDNDTILNFEWTIEKFDTK